jgi:hypothetical protein
MAEYPRFVLHIGANKTGTSSIQKMLFENRQALEDVGWEYPDFHILHMAHHNIAYSILGNPQLSLSVGWENEFHEIVRRRDRRYIFSSELFFRIVDPQKAAQFFPPSETRVVLYLRDHLSYMMSWYAQAIQERNLTASFSDYVKFFSQPFTQFLSAWEKVYGPERIVIRPFVRKDLVGQDTRSDFLQYIDGADVSKFSMAAEDSNLSISGNLLFFKKLLNNYISFEEARLYPIPDEFGAFAEVRDSFNGKFQASAEEVNMVRHVFKDDVANLAARGLYFPPMPKEVKGNLTPNFDTLPEDFAKIKHVATHTDKKFLKYAARLQDWHSL